MKAEDRQVLRELARQIRDISLLPEQENKRELWRRHTALMGDIPPVFVSPEGSWEEILPWASMKCEDAAAAELERELRKRLFRYEKIRDDVPVESSYDIPVSSIPINEGWGITPSFIRSSKQRGAWHHDPVIQTPDDWKKLRKPELVVDREGTGRKAEILRDAVGDLLEINVTGIKIFDFHIAHLYCDFRGLENLMYDLVDDVELVRDVFAFFTEGLEGLVRQAREAGLVQRNDDYTYHYTGGLGYIRSLPGNAGEKIDIGNVWAAAEAQEFAMVSPEMFADTVLPFERRLLEPFGLNGYGCCDDLTEKLDEVLKIRNLRRVAACPWANLEKMAARLGKKYILTWKPDPSFLAQPFFDIPALEAYMTESLRKARNGYPEIILRDTHSCRSHPERFKEFVRVTRRAIEKVYEEEQ